MDMLPSLNSFFSPRDAKQRGKEKPLQAQQAPAAVAGKAIKVGWECSGISLSAAHRLGSGSGVFQVLCYWDVV